jgi:hypothetical protein
MQRQPGNVIESKGNLAADLQMSGDGKILEQLRADMLTRELLI